MTASRRAEEKRRLAALGFIQFEVRSGDPEANLHSLAVALERLHPPADSLLVLPELWATGFCYERLGQIARPLAGVRAEFARLAARYRVLLAGSLPEAIGGGKRWYNTLQVDGPEGPLGRYRKTHPFPGEERAFDASLVPPRPLSTPWGRLGCLVCYDIRFPELARLQAMQGADFLLCPAQWPLARLSHLHALAVARAIENQTYVVVCNALGSNNGVPLGGGSLLVAPDGRVLALADDRPAAMAVMIDWALVEEARRPFRSFPMAPLLTTAADKVAPFAVAMDELAARALAGQRLVSCRLPVAETLPRCPLARLEALRRQGDFLVVALVGAAADVAALQVAALACVDMVVALGEGQDEEQERLRLACLALPFHPGPG